jgi:hypothetical protein
MYETITIFGLIDPSRKIKAIKGLRVISEAVTPSKLGLKEAKAAADHLCNGGTIDIDVQQQFATLAVAYLTEANLRTYETAHDRKFLGDFRDGPTFSEYERLEGDPIISDPDIPF